MCDLPLFHSIYDLSSSRFSQWVASVPPSYQMAFRCHLLLFGLLLPLFPLLGYSLDNPFSPKASLLRQWKRLFPTERLPAILLHKASPLNASQVALFSNYISHGSLSSHLPAFCTSANLFCDLKAPANVTRDVSGDSDFESYSNKDFRRYQRGAVFGNDNFRNYSVGENVARDTFLRYGKDGSGTEQFTNYAVSSNVGGSGFSNYDENSNGGLGSFQSYGKDSNVQGHDFAAYGAASSGVLDTFTSYSDQSNVVKNDFKGYGKDANAMSSFFTSYSNNSNVGTSSFQSYDADGNGGSGTFNNYGDKENIAGNVFRSYDENGNSAFRQFASYGEAASQSDNSFKSYGKDNNAPFEDFSNYGNSTVSSKNEFVKYNEDASGIPTTRFATYVGNQTSFKQYFGAPGTFTDYINVSQASVEPGKFFRRANLVEGKFIPMPDIRDKMPPRSFLPRALADRLPFESARLPELVRLLGAQGLQGAMAKTVADCESPPVKDETKRCPTSLEAMSEFAASVLGKSAAVSTTESTVGWGKTLVVGKVAPRRGGGETAAVSCHQSLFPYLVYYCHAVPRVAVYDVELKEKAGGDTVNRGVAICHLDTSQWSAGHAAFVALGPAPGKIEVCHWIFENDLIWVAREG